MKFHLISLGCSKNTVDSEGVVGTLIRHGWHWENAPESADLVLINTCGFIKDAKEESLRHIISMVQLKKSRPGMRVCAFGCMVKRYRQELQQEIPEVDRFVDFFTPEETAGLLRQFPAHASFAPSGKPVYAQRVFTPPHIGFLKVAEGCDNRCSYCAIPLIRGGFRSRPFQEVVADAKALAKSGAREISVIAQDTTRFGLDLEGRCLLPELAAAIATIPEIGWIRLHYLHPKRLDPDFLDRLFGLPKVLPYFDIPFQHVSDRMLSLMNRGVDRKHLLSLVGHIRRRFRRGVIRTTFIVGFPGETEQDFQQLIDFLQRHPLDRVGAFPYSTEEGTAAAGIKPKVPHREKLRRLDELMTLQQVLAAERNQRWIGRRVDLLIDRIEGDEAVGRTFGDAWEVDNTIRLKYDGTFSVGDIFRVRITTAEAYDFTAERVPETLPAGSPREGVK